MKENQETAEHAHGHPHGKPDRDSHIIVNGRPKTVSSDTLSFLEVVALAYDPVRTEPGVLYTVSFSRGPKENPEGELTTGNSVKLKNGMAFLVTETDKS